MRHEFLIGALHVREEPFLELIQHLEIIGRFSCSAETRLQLQNILYLFLMLLLVGRSTAVTGFSKDSLLMGKVDAGVGNKLIKDVIELLAVTSCHQPLVQIVDQDGQLFMVVIQHLNVHTHFTCPDYKRHSRWALSGYILLLQGCARSIFSYRTDSCKLIHIIKKIKKGIGKGGRQGESKLQAAARDGFC